ncbi:hypothetical protein [Cryobacterium tagatosivorans]|uniref:Uncharacterized protein n=1 Tax=Cryobacterium tagatosivorans TaxID=1259199 RepID=A0A4V3I618_9MICO|nr:hypothetical protein [Cryobacterium tagatosivorans]TFB46503.1 hypothetical protein E3O23_17085 [Cryobacterium tagatosivorans]
MTQDEIALWVQVAAVLAAVGASIVALVISAKDRNAAHFIAAEDRKFAQRHSKLMFELETLVRLLENRNRGGSTDREESSRMGAEALTLVGLIGPERLPRQWERAVSMSDEGLRQLQDDAGFPQYKRDAIETQLAVSAVVAEIRIINDR